MVILSQATFWYGQNRLSGALPPLRPRQKCHAKCKIGRLQNCRFSGRFWAVFPLVLHGKNVAVSFPSELCFATDVGFRRAHFNPDIMIAIIEYFVELCYY